jgi:hypothetical protein
MALIPCFDHAPDLKEQFKKLLNGKEDLPEQEQREIGKKLAIDYHKGLHDELNTLRKKIGVKPVEYTNPLPPDKPIEKRISGIAQRVQEQLGLKPYEKGKGWSKEESLSFGKAAIEHGIDPMKVVTDPKYSDLSFEQKMAVVQAHNNQLTKEMYQAGDKFGEDSKQFKDAQNELKDFQEKASPIRTAWAMAGVSQQGEIDIDTDSFTGLKHSFTEYNKGKEPTPQQQETAKSFVDKIKQQDKKINDLQNKLKQLHENVAKETSKPQREKLSTQLSDIAKRLRTSAEFDDFLKSAQGDIKKMGVDLPRLKEIAASILEDAAAAVKLGENAIDFIREAVGKLKEDVDKDKLINGLNAIGEKEGLFDIKETPEEKNIKRLQKQLDDLRQGNIKQANEKREPSEKEKELKDEIFEAKKNAGLVPSKPLPEKPEATLTPAEKNIKRLEKTLEDLENGIVKHNAEKREPTPEEKELQEKIFEAKKNLGLVKSKQQIDTPQSIEEERQSIGEDFADKKGNNFTPEEAGKIWSYAQKNYLDNGAKDFDNVVTNVATDLGLSREQVIHAISQPKGAKAITDKMYGEMSDKRRFIGNAEAWAKSANNSKLYKLLKTIINVPFSITTAYHGTVGAVTHAGLYIYQPLEWEAYFKKFGEQYPNAFGNKGQYEQKMRAITNHPRFNFWVRNGLQIDPSKATTDDYLTGTKFFKNMAEYGTRGFNTLKDMRLTQAENIWNKMSDAQKADPEMPKTIARMVNLGSGTTADLKLPEWANTASSAVMFAPKLTASQVQRIATEPTKMVATIFNWKNATPSEKFQAKYVAGHIGQTLAMMSTFLLANQAALNISGSKEKINWSHPLDSDWLKFKGFGYSIDATGGMLSMTRFLASLAQETVRANIPEKTKEKQKPSDVEGKVILKELKGKASPFLGDVMEFTTGTDYNNRPIPWSQVELTKKQKEEGITKHTYSSFIAEHAPIPVSEAYKTIEDNARANGMPEWQINNVLKGFLIGAINGATGVRLAPDYKLTEKKQATGEDQSVK